MTTAPAHWITIPSYEKRLSKLNDLSLAPWRVADFARDFARDFAHFVAHQVKTSQNKTLGIPYTVMTMHRSINGYRQTVLRYGARGLVMERNNIYDRNQCGARLLRN